jgi:hypothetical protein
LIEAKGGGRGRTAYAVLLVLTLLSGLGTAVVFDRPTAGLSLFELTNLVGPTAQGLLLGDGMLVCTDAMGTPGNPICFHAARMPAATVTVALGVKLLGNHFLRVGLMKALLLMIPLELALYLVCLRLPVEKRRRWLAIALLLAPFAMTAFLADLVNLQVEEGYAYSFLALAVAVVLFRGTRSGWLRRDGWGEGLVLGLAVAGVYLSKSAMAPAAAVLTVAFVLRTRSGAAKALALALALAAPVGWAMHQHAASGRYSVGTSVDGINLHKGENPHFLSEYPPARGETLDGFDTQLNAGQRFNDEWSFNDFHQRAAMNFMREHPGAALRGDVRKLFVVFVAVRKYGSSESHGLRLALEMGGFLLFRLIFWAALGVSAVALWRGERSRGDGVVFLLLVAAVALPYTLGFAYTRHVSVLIYPSVLLCCRMLAGTEPAEGLH